ncbi:MAG: ABC transporter ATP-binding protein [Oscillospiraceae bacterium]|nr:ABC transporter ATP-binding protein [Oscillospiraceae bacterium]
MDSALLRLENLEKSFGETRVLRGVSLSADAGQFITLLGPSGCGKTTTLRIIAGLESPDTGKVWLDGRDVTSAEPNKRDVNTVFQSYALFPHMTVEDNIGYGLRLRRKPKAEIRRAVKDALALVQLDGYEKRMTSELSGGQSQRIAIARAVIGNPKVLLLDEPLGALDYQLRRQMQLELKRLQKQLGITFIYITHDQEEALNMSDVIAVMRNGMFEQLGSVSEIYDAPKTAYVARFVGNANIVSGVVKDVSDGVITLARSDGEMSVKLTGAPPERGATVHAAVRGENVQIEPLGRDGQPPEPIVGTISDKRFAGGQLRISVTLSDGTEVTASRHGIDSPLAAGERVAVWWSPDHAVTVEGDNEA